jgi:hypothetical protein
MRIINVGLLHARLAWLRARYDHGACSSSIYKVIKELEQQIAWLEHHKRPVDRSFLQQNWPMKHKRRSKRRPGFAKPPAQEREK